MSSLSTLPKGDSAWLLRKSIQRIMQQVSVLETNIGSSTTGNSANTQVIFNDAGTLRGDAGLTYNKTTDLLTVGAATITGDLTVDTNTLKVDSANDRVGIGTASVAAYTNANLVVYGAANGILAIANSTAYSNFQKNGTDFFLNTNVTGAGANAGSFVIRHGSSYTEQFRIAYDGVATWSNVGGVAGTAMTLNSTGLGVGAVPSGNNQLTVRSSGAGTEMTVSLGRASAEGIIGIAAGTNGFVTGSVAGDMVVRSIGKLMLFNNGANSGITIDTAANVGIGVTPSAWGSPFKALQVSRAALRGSTATTGLSFNAYSDGTTLKYIAAGLTALDYYQNSGKHVWQIAGVGANANDPITFTEAMTLDASGNLLVGTTGLNATWNTRLTLSSDSGTTRWAVGPYSTATNFVISAASGGGVYLNGTAATSWTSASDERLKDIIEPISNAIAKVGSLRSVIGKFKNDETNTRRSFLIAQDVQAVLPEAVDASNPDRLGVAYSDVIPLLVAAIKELTAEVNALKNA